MTDDSDQQQQQRTDEQEPAGEGDSGLPLSRRTMLKGAGASALGAGLLSGMSSPAAADHLDTVSVGSGSYTTEKPEGEGSDLGSSHWPDPPWDWFGTVDTATPMPTSRWFSSVGMSNPDQTNFSQGMMPSPLYASCTPKGFEACYPDGWNGTEGTGDPARERFVTADYQDTQGIRIGHADTAFSQTFMEDWGDWSVTGRWKNDEGALRVTVAAGSPFMFAEYEGRARITLTDSVYLTHFDGAQGGGFNYPDDQLDFDRGNPVADDTVTVWAGDAESRVLGVSHNGQHFGIFAPGGTTWDGIGTSTLESDLGEGSHLAVAALPDNNPDTLDLFEKYAYNFVTDTTVEWTYDQDASEVRTTFSFATDNKPESDLDGDQTLTALFPHQHKYTDHDTLAHEYWSPQGPMKTVADESFEVVYTYSGVLPYLPDTESVDEAKLQRLLEERASKPHAINSNVNSTYWAGKVLNGNERMLAMADQYDASAIHEDYMTYLSDRLAGWFTVQSTAFDTVEGEEVFYYDQATSNAMYGFPSSGSFGSVAHLTDSHFHWGYFINAAAEVTRQDPEWGSDEGYGGMVELLVRDIANPENDGTFPKFRMFGPYTGHSRANSGNHVEKGGNQESSSEAVNAWAGIVKWAEYRMAQANSDAERAAFEELRDVGVYLYTTESHAVWEYWFDRDNDSHPDDWGEYPGLPGPNGSYELCPTVFDVGYRWDVWWNAGSVDTHYGVNWLPVAPHSMYLARDPSYAKLSWQKMLDAKEQEGGGTNFTYLDVFWCYRALTDGENARELMDLSTLGEGFDVTKAYTYKYVQSMADLGVPDRTVTADTTLYSVWDDGTEKTYAAYNPEDSERTVTFSDGTELTVPAETMGTTTGPSDYVPPTSAPQHVTASVGADTTVTVSWDPPAVDADAVDHYNVYVDGEQSTQVAAGTTDATLDLASFTSYDFHVTAVNGAGTESEQSVTVTETTGAPTQTAHGDGPTPVPGTVQAEHFDDGGAGVAYMDATAENEGGAGRAGESVDVASTGGGSGQKVTATAAGEWLEYTISAEQTAVFAIHVTVASESEGQLRVVVGRTAKSVSVPDTGGQWRQVTVKGAFIEQGENVVRLEVEQGGFDVDAIEFEETTTDLQKPYGDGPIQLPGRIQAQDFDEGGEGIAYMDTTDTNSGGAYRPKTSVDIQETGDSSGEYNVGWISTGEWLEYTVQVESAGTYTVKARVASAQGGGAFEISVDGGEPIATVEAPGTGGWQSWTTVTVEGVELPAGEHVIRFDITASPFNINWVAFTQGGGTTTTETPEPTETPTDTPADTPVDTPTETPTDTPTEARSTGTTAGGGAPGDASTETTGGSGPGLGLLAAGEALTGAAALKYLRLRGDDTVEAPLDPVHDVEPDGSTRTDGSDTDDATSAAEAKGDDSA